MEAIRDYKEEVYSLVGMTREEIWTLRDILGQVAGRGRGIHVATMLAALKEIGVSYKRPVTDFKSADICFKSVD